jgi:hypothetical protein
MVRETQLAVRFLERETDRVQRLPKSTLPLV